MSENVIFLQFSSILVEIQPIWMKIEEIWNSLYYLYSHAIDFSKTIYIILDFGSFWVTFTIFYNWHCEPDHTTIRKFYLLWSNENGKYKKKKKKGFRDGIFERKSFFSTNFIGCKQGIPSRYCTITRNLNCM